MDMQVTFQQISFPDNIKGLVREVVSGVPDGEVPDSWQCVMIFHPATGQYYSTKCKYPLRYETVVYLRTGASWAKVAVVLRRMLKQHPQFQFFIHSIQARPQVEKWMADQGYVRVSTKMGEGAAEPRVLFKVYSPFNRIARYVSASPLDSKAMIIARANASFASWLASPTRKNYNEHKTMCIALRSKNAVNTRVFEKEAVITKTDLLKGRRYGEYRVICARANLKAIHEFIRSTVTGNF